ncbi:hypothetical protein PoB_003393300 [Plakobranchus ocellatus]|uniref:Uncharacterized protein n=1 Tax=Plakobranchus ocellatus TaxID=259542 RepID=A0AAV4AKW1_9GAST|nr:hypothetical protein PoB_003393300 [Plakobranchus ocellatus]
MVMLEVLVVVMVVLVVMVIVLAMVVVVTAVMVMIVEVVVMAAAYNAGWIGVRPNSDNDGYRNGTGDEGGDGCGTSSDVSASGYNGNGDSKVIILRFVWVDCDIVIGNGNSTGYGDG